MIKITINVPWGHGDSPHERVIKALEAMLYLARNKQAGVGGMLTTNELSRKGNDIVGSYLVEFGE